MNQPSILARAPNSGKIAIGTVDTSGSLVRTNDPNAKGAIFHFNYPRSSQWVKDGTKNIWVSGYFNVGWSDETVPVASIGDNTLRLAGATVYGVYSSIKGPNNYDRDKLAIRGFYFFNILDELDTAGEYFIDTDNQLLYFWLDKSALTANVHLSILQDPILSVTNLPNISFEGISFAYSRGAGVTVRNSSKIVFRHDAFSGLATDGIATFNCNGCIVDRCKFSNLGASGVILDGGDRTNLVPANDVVRNSEFFRTAGCFGVLTLPST